MPARLKVGDRVRVKESGVTATVVNVFTVAKTDWNPRMTIVETVPRGIYNSGQVVKY